MIDGVIVKKISKNSDSRGWLAEIYRSDETDFLPAMAYISITKPKVVRGPHEHQYQSDCFVFIGPGNFEIHLWDRRPESKTKNQHEKIGAGADNPLLIIVPPGVVHGYKCISKQDGWCVNLPDKLYLEKNRKGKKDEIRWEDDPESPYKIN